MKKEEEELQGGAATARVVVNPRDSSRLRSTESTTRHPLKLGAPQRLLRASNLGVFSATKWSSTSCRCLLACSNSSTSPLKVHKHAWPRGSDIIVAGVCWHVPDPSTFKSAHAGLTLSLLWNATPSLHRRRLRVAPANSGAGSGHPCSHRGQLCLHTGLEYSPSLSWFLQPWTRSMLHFSTHHPTPSIHEEMLACVRPCSHSFSSTLPSVPHMTSFFLTPCSDSQTCP